MARLFDIYDTNFFELLENADTETHMGECYKEEMSHAGAALTSDLI